MGLPVLIAFSKINEVVGFDINNQRINCLSKGIDKNNEVDTEDLILKNFKYELTNGQKQILKELDARVDAQREQVKIKLQDAIEEVKKAGQF